MSNNTLNSNSLQPLNPSDEFEKVFLIVPSDEPLTKVQEVGDRYGTGFFINDSGLFLSVSHNFHDRVEEQDYKYVYAVLKNKNGICFLTEIDKKVIDTNKDYAIGKIDVRCDSWIYDSYTNERNVTLSGIKDKRLLGQPDGLPESLPVDMGDEYIAQQQYINQCIHLYNRIYFDNSAANNIVFYNTEVNLIVLNQVNPHEYKTQHTFVDIAYLVDNDDDMLYSVFILDARN